MRLPVVGPGFPSGRGPEISRGPGITRATRDAELAAQGWEHRFIGAPPRLAELAELYETLGQEVLLDPVLDNELATDCAGCLLALTHFRVIYTRVSEQSNEPPGHFDEPPARSDEPPGTSATGSI